MGKSLTRDKRLLAPLQIEQVVVHGSLWCVAGLQQKESIYVWRRPYRPCSELFEGLGDPTINWFVSVNRWDDERGIPCKTKDDMVTAVLTLKLELGL